ncbi:uncharacterized protein LOC123920632 [Trifolium pratense]|uniref:uncharacterized protein LOC123920632 n=1 Tax=Trifolium pratense TaxID=57577 RepID=UPI001E692CCE|nr:uncharacterized protein LOC123920632 [Trifolium pratense]
MATIFKLLSLTIFLGLIFQAYGQPCSLNNIVVKQKPGKEFPWWDVNVSNNCSCTQSQVKFNCTEFTNYTPSVDPSILNKDCLLIQGRPLHYSESVNFSYVLTEQFTFQTISSEIACS